MSVLLIILIVVVVVAVIAAAYSGMFTGKVREIFGGAQEVEARFLNIEPATLREKIRALGGDQVYQRRKFRRNVYNLAGKPGYARVRDEGDSTTMTVKTYENPKFPEEKEVTTTANFDAASEFMGSILDKKAYHETYREKWSMPGTNEVVIDTIPGFLPYCEIECDTEEQLRAAAEKLGFKWEDAHFGAYGTTFEEYYGISRKFVNDELRTLKFDTVAAELGNMVTKNKEIFEKSIEYNKGL